VEEAEEGNRNLDRKPLNRKPRKLDIERLKRYVEVHPEPICGRWQRSLVGEKQHRQGTETDEDHH
jgi:hypothetical protein